MLEKADVQRFILLPARGVQAGERSNPKTASFLRSLHIAAAAALGPLEEAVHAGLRLTVIDSVRENGAKLVELSPQQTVALRAAQPDVRIVPVVYYYPAVASRYAVLSHAITAAKAAGVKITLKIVSKKDGTAIAGADVVAFTDFDNRVGASGRTNKKGEVSLNLGASSRKIERLYMYAERGFWSGLKKNITIAPGKEFSLVPIDVSFKDCLRFFYGSSPDSAGRGLKVGVVDTGIASEPDLTIDGGFNAVKGEDPNDFGDNGNGHGTHVAGIIAAHGKPPKGIRGLAPAVTLRSYRVFGKGVAGASNFDILKALDRAVEDRCDIVNMSLGGGEPDDATHDAITHARANGTLVVAASGNDDRSPVSSPASDPLAIAVSALGRKGTVPAGSTETGDVLSPYGTDKKNYIASFSNVGPEIDLTAPGDGIISTFPGGYAVLDGTSMACPAVTGASARILGTLPGILSMGRDQARSDEMAKALFQRAKALGFGQKFEGQGLLKI
jgi:subtilisin family serine protease